MAKKKAGKHLQFYSDCINMDEMPRSGLCGCAWGGYIDEELLFLFKPEYASMWSYWASGDNRYSKKSFSPLRQTIVLFMAAINGEL